MLDPQVQIRIIDLAAKWTDNKTVPSNQEYIETKTKYFDQAYKAILKTVQPETKPVRPEAKPVQPETKPVSELPPVKHVG